MLCFVVTMLTRSGPTSGLDNTFSSRRTRLPAKHKGIKGKQKKLLHAITGQTVSDPVGIKIISGGGGSIGYNK